MAVKIASIVEGDGEVIAFQVLLRRIINRIDPQIHSVIAPPFRQPSGTIRRSNGFETAVNAVADLYPEHSIFLLLDADDDCPMELGSAMQARIRVARPDLQVSVVLANREYEAWFLASAESLAGKRNLPNRLNPPINPEDIRDAKGWLTKQMPMGRRYSPTRDQAALSAMIDFDLAKNRSRSFRKLWKELELLITNALRPHPPTSPHPRHN